MINKESQKIITDTKEIRQYNLDTVNKEIKQLFTELQKIIGCTYITYVFEDFETNKLCYFSTDPKWQEEFILTGMVNNCHIYLNAIENSNNGMYAIVWNYLKKLTKLQKEIHHYRESKNISNGIGFLQQTNNFRESFSFASKKNNDNFYRNFADYKKIKNYLTTLREIKTLN